LEQIDSWGQAAFQLGMLVGKKNAPECLLGRLFLVYFPKNP